jgi:hypothetical protein
MDQPVKLKYHQATFDLLDERPLLSKPALRRINGWERYHKVSLPASIREWYSLEGAEDRLRYGDPATRILQDDPLRKKLREVAKQFRTREPGSFKGFPVVPGEEDMAFYARLGRAADPLVHIVWYPDKWGVTEGSFSVFVFCWVWDNFACHRPAARNLSLVAVEPTFSAMELDFLIDHFTEGPRQVTFRGRRKLRKRRQEGPEAVESLFAPVASAPLPRKTCPPFPDSEPMVYAKPFGLSVLTPSVPPTTKHGRTPPDRLSPH